MAVALRLLLAVGNEELADDIMSGIGTLGGRILPPKAWLLESPVRYSARERRDAELGNLVRIGRGPMDEPEPVR